MPAAGAVPLTLEAAQAPTAACVPRLKTEPAGYSSLPLMVVLAPTLPPGWLAVSSNASITVAATVATLLPVAVSLSAPVVAVKVTPVTASLAPPAVPGAV